MEQDSKVQYFEYIIFKLFNWSKERYLGQLNDFSVLKTMKLLFFVTAAKASKEEAILLDEVFDNFYAMPFGPVESDVYDIVRKKHGLLEFYQIDNISTSQVSEPDFSNLNKRYTSAIDSSVELLLSSYPDLFDLGAFELVDLSHMWRSWKVTFKEAQNTGRLSKYIENDLIKSDDKIFNTSLFTFSF